jgi:glycosyltransferase involved in cell wall biosynthesis
MITVILNSYKRSQYLPEQVKAIQNQTIPVEEIMVWSNKPEEGVQYNIDDLDIKAVYSNHNFKFHARFAFGLLAKTEYVAFFDDDTIPGPKWFESCLKHSTEDIILGSAGVKYLGDAYDPHEKYGWNGTKSSKLEYVDLVGHSWFMKRSTLRHLWAQDPISWENGEDIQLSGFSFLYGGIKTAVPPHTLNNQEEWGSIKGMEYGNDNSASHWKSNHSPLRNKISSTLIKQGYKKVIDRI